MGTHKSHIGTHTYQGFTSTQTQIDIEAAVSPQGVNINICPCHTHKDEGCRLAWPHMWQYVKNSNVGKDAAFFF